MSNIVYSDEQLEFEAERKVEVVVTYRFPAWTVITASEASRSPSLSRPSPLIRVVSGTLLLVERWLVVSVVSREGEM